MVMDTLATSLHESALSHTLRASFRLYPLINTRHVVGIALLFGAIAPLDLRLAGIRRLKARGHSNTESDRLAPQLRAPFGSLRARLALRTRPGQDVTAPRVRANHDAG